MLFIVPFVLLLVVTFALVLLAGAANVALAPSSDKIPALVPREDLRLQVQTLQKFRVKVADIAAGKASAAQARDELKNLNVSIEFALISPESALLIVLASLRAMRSKVGQSSAATSIFGSALSSKLVESWNR